MKKVILLTVISILAISNSLLAQNNITVERISSEEKAKGQTALVADFSVSRTVACIGEALQLTDLSTGSPIAWSWNFSGGTPSVSTLQNPVVTYTAAGSYNVALGVTDGTNTSTTGKLGFIKVEVCSKLDGHSEDLLRIYPNPASGYIQINPEMEGFYKLYDVLGSVVLEGDLTKNIEHFISIEKYPSGVYFLTLQRGRTVRTVKVIKE